MAINHLNAFLTEIKQAVVPLIVKFDNVDTRYGTEAYQQLHEEAVHAMRPAVSDLSISGACMAAKVLWTEYERTDEEDAPAEYEALYLAATILESFIAEASSATDQDAKARIDYFLETESRSGIGDDDRTILMHNVARELRFVLSVGGAKRRQGNMPTFGLWQTDWAKRSVNV